LNRILQIAWQRWQVIAHVNGDYIARLFVNLFYFTVLVPFALITKLSDPLALRNAQNAEWKTRKPVSAKLEDARNQF
jgi:hypothetical protein